MPGTSRILGAIAAAAVVVTTSCVRADAFERGGPKPGATITFHNESRDRIQVYLVDEKENWMIGRLEPLQTARLALPRFGFVSATRAVSLAVVSGWWTDRRLWREARTTLSIDELTNDLPGQEWSFAEGKLTGPLRGRPR